MPMREADSVEADGRAHPRRATNASMASWLASYVIWTILAVLSVWSVVRLTGADEIRVLARPLVPVLAFTPYAALASIVPAACAAALRHWRTFAVAAALAGTFALAVLPRAVGDSATPATGPLLRVLTANMRFGHADPHVLVGLTRRLRVDVLSLQEFTTQSDAALGRAGLSVLLPYKIADPIGGALGSALFARHPLRALPISNVAAVGLAMPRAMLEERGVRVELMAVHMAKPLGRKGVTQWTSGLATVPVSRPGGPVQIVAGDFNSTVDDARLRRVIGGGYVDAASATGAGLVPTFHQRPWPSITIDHVLVDARCAVRRVSVYDLPRSDHRAVFTELRLP